jgi:hypothetical protein
LRRSSLTTFALTLGIAAAASPARADEIPRLRWDRPVRCMTGPDGKMVRVQCDNDAHPTECLVAPNFSAEGTELRRVSECSVITDPKAYAILSHTGARMTAAVAEAPPGFSRSDKGRAYQTKFDLLDRVFIGLAYAPVFARGGEGTPTPQKFSMGLARAELGMDASLLSSHGRSRHDFQVLTGALSFTDFHFNGLVFAYDYQQVHRRPAFWVTTFFGDPKVYPAAIPFGWGTRLLNVEDRPAAAPSTFDMEITEVHLSWNPWQSSDMYSRLRLEAGADVGKAWADRTQIANGLSTGRWYAGFTSALRLRVALGDGGLHYLFADVAYLHPTLIPNSANPALPLNKLKGTVAYERVLIAINDQPLSLRLTAGGTVRDDLAGGARNVEISSTAGLRFSFWAPPRIFEPLPELEDP